MDESNLEIGQDTMVVMHDDVMDEEEVILGERTDDDLTIDTTLGRHHQTMDDDYKPVIWYT